MTAKHEKRLAARRAVYEATALPDKILAEAFGWTEFHLARTAKGQKWPKAPASLAELNRRARRLLEGRLSAIETQLASAKLSAAGERALNDQALKVHTALQAMARHAGDEKIREEQAISDEEYTATLGTIDEHIQRLASHMAE